MIMFNTTFEYVLRTALVYSGILFLVCGIVLSFTAAYYYNGTWNMERHSFYQFIVPVPAFTGRSHYNLRKVSKYASSSENLEFEIK